PHEGLLRRRCQQRKRLRLQLAAARHRRSFAFRLLARYGGRKNGGAVRHGAEPGGRRFQWPAGTQSSRQTEMAGSSRHGRDRDCFFLAGFSRSRARGAFSRKHRNRSFSLPCRRNCGKRRNLHEHATVVAIPKESRNGANERNPHDLLGHGWGFAWPNDCRIIYNRASARPDGKPWSERKKLVWWDEEKKQWGGLDNPDYPKEVSPDTKDNLARGKGVEALGGARPFTLHPDGVGWLYVASGLKDGPLPTHYEPLESPVSNPLYKQNVNPAALKRERPDNPYANSPGDPRFPYVLSTYRLTEQHTAGGMTRTLSHLAELQPELFTEVSPELADEIGLV